MTTAPKSTDNLFADVLNAKQDQASQAGDAGNQEEETEAETETESPPAADELDYLKKRAKLMGLTFSNNIGVDALKAKINAKLNSEETETEAKDENKDDAGETNEDDDEQKTPLVAQVTTLVTPRTRIKNLRQRMKEEQMRLLRLRITNLNPSKKDLPGEILTFSNKILGTVRKFVPYGEATENGYHVPYCLYLQLKEREFQNIKVRKDSRGRSIIETGMAREFALEVLPPLTERELAQLAASQAAAKGMD